MSRTSRSITASGCRPELVQAACGLAVLGALLRVGLPALGYEVAIVDGASMQPTFRTGDVLLVEHGHRTEQGDIVLFETEAAGRCVKRVSGVAGDLGARVPGRNWASVISLRGRTHFPNNDSVRPVRLAYDELFLEGDNPALSSDSRAFGPVPRHAVLGRVIGHVDAPASASLAGFGAVGLLLRRKRRKAGAVGK